MRAAFFDMDRTLVRVSTGHLYIRWRFQERQAGFMDVLRYTRWMMAYTLGIIDPEDVGRRALEALKGVSEDSFRKECEAWYTRMVRPHVTDRARAEVAARREAGDEVVILTASTPYAARPLAEDLGIEHVICSHLAVEDGLFTGGIERLCYGDRKVSMAYEWAGQAGVDVSASAFYTDSVSDLPMLEEVAEPRVVNPDPRLRWTAHQRKWPVERWT